MWKENGFFLKGKTYISVFKCTWGRKIGQHVHKTVNGPSGGMCPRIFVTYPSSIFSYLNTAFYLCFLLLFLPYCVQLFQVGLIYHTDISKLTPYKTEHWTPTLPMPLEIIPPSPWHVPLFLLLGPKSMSHSSLLSFCFF